MVAITDASGTLTSQQRYLPFGGIRTNIANGPITTTDYGYTGQRNLDEDIGLMDYKFRFYSDTLGRFISPDNIVPDTTNPQAFNKYSYVLNRPIIMNDPTGHDSIINEFLSGVASEVVSSIGWFVPQIQTDLAPSEGESVAKLAGRVVGSIASIGIGLLAFGAGEATIGGGGLCAALTAGGCTPMAVPAVAGGVALMAQATGMGVRGAAGLGASIMMMAKKHIIYKSTTEEGTYIGRTNQGIDTRQAQHQKKGFNRVLEKIKELLGGKTDAEALEMAKLEEQIAINEHGGIQNLTNKRNELNPNKFLELLNKYKPK